MKALITFANDEYSNVTNIYGKFGLLVTFFLFSISLSIGQNDYDEQRALDFGREGWRELELGNYDNSISQSQMSLRSDSTKSYVYFNIALAYLLKGEIETSLKEYKTAILVSKRFGIAKAGFIAAIEDIVKYKESISDKELMDTIVELIHEADQEYENTTTIFLKAALSNGPEEDLLVPEHPRWDISGLRIIVTDSLGNKIWVSEKIKDFETDISGYYLNVEIPEIVFLKIKNMDYEYFYETWVNHTGSLQSIETFYSSEIKPSTYSIIKLHIRSDPTGAEVFLVPRRIWLEKFNGKKWKSFEDSYMDRFRVNGASTNAVTHIDETNYMIIFKLNNAYKTRNFVTKPASVEPVQTVSIRF